MATISARLRGFPIIEGIGISVEAYLASKGMRLLHRGKVRDTYVSADHPDRLVVVASDRISIYDFVLGTLVPYKGQVLTALSHFWQTHVLSAWPNHLISSEVAPAYNAAFDLYVENGADYFPLSRTLVVEKQQMEPYELIFRQHLGGSVWKAYERTGVVSGIELPLGLKKWQKLPIPLFTPSTKAVEGHDVNITAAAYYGTMGGSSKNRVRDLSTLYQYAYDYAKKRGILILDTKFEVGRTLADEVLTPDSSRFTTVADYESALSDGRDPVFFDKQNVREWGRNVRTPFGVLGINNLDPQNVNHREFVAHYPVPQEIVEDTTQRYLEIFQMITGTSLTDYQVSAMGV